MDRRTKVELFEQIRREYTHGTGTIQGAARKLRYATPPGRHRHPDPAAMDGTPRHRIDYGLPQGRSEQRRSGPNQQGEPSSIRVVVLVSGSKRDDGWRRGRD